MADETELERMVVRLVGDAAEYQRMMKEAQDAAKETAAAVAEADRQVKELKGFQWFANSAVDAMSTVSNYARSTLSTAFSQVDAKLTQWGNYSWSWLQKGMDGFIALEGTTLKLTAAIEQNGRAAGPVLKSYESFAKAIAETTTATKGQVLGMLQVAESMGLQDDQAKRAVKNSLALAAAKGGEAESYMRMAIQLERGHLGRMAFMLGLQGEGDETEKVAKAHEMLSRMYGVVGAEQQSLGGQIKMLEKEWKAYGKQFNAVIGEGAKPIVEFLRFAVSMLGQMSYGMKVAVVTAAALAAAWVGLIALIALAGKTFNFFFGGVGILAGVIITGLGLVTAGAGALVVTLGGVSGFFALIKEKAIAAWEWLKPVRQALGQLWDTLLTTGLIVWNALKAAAQAAMQAFTAAMGSAGSIDWASVQAGLVGAVLAAEYTLLNFSKVADVVWLGFQLGFIVAADTVLFFFTDQLPALLAWFGTNWRDVFSTAFGFIGTVLHNALLNLTYMFMTFFAWLPPNFMAAMKALGNGLNTLLNNLVAVFQNLRGLIRGTVKFEDIWKPLGEAFTAEFSQLNLTEGLRPLTEGFENKIGELPKIPERQAGVLEQTLRNEFEAMGGALQEDYEAFAARRIAEFANQSKKAGDAVGGGVADPMAKATKEIQKFDSALSGSAEALTRIAEYKDKLAGRELGAVVSGRPTGVGGGSSANQPVFAGGAGAAGPAEDPWKPAVLALLSKIAEAVTRVADRDVVEVEQADLEDGL